MEVELVTQNAVRAILHRSVELHQVEMLRRLRLPIPIAPSRGPAEVIFLTINGIAAGLKNTG
jgi:phosphoenolpyruvate carboxylase